VFTVGGAIGSFVLGQAYAWIGWLFVAVGLLALTAHAVALHRRVRELEATNRKLTEQAAEADRRLNAVPIAVVEQLVGVVASGASARLVEILVGRIAQVERIRRFVKLDAKPLNPRTFTKAAGRLYAIAKVATQEQAAVLVVGDEFSLVRKADSGVFFICARLRLNQSSEKGEIVFEVLDAASGEMTGLSQLADGGDVRGITGYFIQPAIDVTAFPEFSAEAVNAIVRQVIVGFNLNVGVGA
jgi:hypothetical protein